MPTFDDRVAIMFGAARGIGEATARGFVRDGGRVVIGDILDDDGRRLQEELGGDRCQYVRCDVAVAEDISAAYAHLDRSFGRLDVVVNNVGVVRYGTVDVLSIQDWELTIRTNLTAQFISCHEAIPRLRQAGGGVIVNTASILGHASQKTTAAYAASKAGVMGLTRTIAIDHAKEGIRCVSVSPGTIDTPLVRIAADTFVGRDPDELMKEWGAAHPMGRIGTVSEVAEVILFLASPAAGFITGTDLLIDGGIRSELYG